MFVTARYARSTKPNDAMYLWLENVQRRGFEVCAREFLPFDGKHEDTTVVSKTLWVVSCVIVFSFFLAKALNSILQ